MAENTVEGTSSRPPQPTQEQLEDVARRFTTTTDMVVEARKRLHGHAWDFLVGGSESEATLLRNRLALDMWALRPRILRDVTSAGIDPSSSLLGAKLRIPVFFAPVGEMTMYDPNGALGPARAAGERGLMSFLSSVSKPAVEDAAAEANGRLVLQLYVRGDSSWVDAYVERVAACGGRAICFTLDTDAYSRRERNLLNRFNFASANQQIMVNTGREHQERFNWSDIARVRSKYNLPVILKGIATAEDAKMAVEHGVAVVYVSNHGGRQLDQGQGTLEMLPEIVEAVAGQAEVVIDGGFVRGTDVLKAIALGAKAVGIGKLQGWALMAGGEAGMHRLIDLLEGEIVNDMMMMGITKLDQLTPKALAKSQPVNWPSPVSAFPHLHRFGRDWG